MTKIISIINHKGGVGKTTTTANLGAALANLDKKILLVDFDPQANLSDHLGIPFDELDQDIVDVIMDDQSIEPFFIKENLHIVAGNLELAAAEKEFSNSIKAYIKLKKALKSITESYDFVLIDCPPSLGFFTLNALNASTDVIIPVEPEGMAAGGLQTVRDAISEVQDVNDDIKLLGVLITKQRGLVVGKDLEESIRDNHQPVFETVIRNYKHFPEASTLGLSIFDHAPSSNAALDYASLAKEVMNG
ncbi:ParA family protein [Aureibacter tunicatorum]|uniref:Chromosome partitioning protein n=1 Tax=Aureibacter tunicatorum TaxID=866807 RepID=A0AAE3XQH6_9BACT|nr:ParA family protein [Aureibacter tunicatorum]MDR6240727.1 chromosome partitioning protein [Aureibacter tunicatorum]BDD06940.1 sporulation initiation inhibitor Soj [Aureibacter tunicatorum]